MAGKGTASRMHVALLRGINVGKAGRVAMADLKALVEGFGYRDVRTLFASGNVVFDAPASVRGDPAPRIERALAERLRVSSRVLVLTAAELAKAVAGNPLALPSRNPSRLFVHVLFDPADRRKLLPFARQDWAPEALAIGARVAYTWCPEGFLKSPVNEALARALGDAATFRNWNTMRKLAGLAGIA